MPNEPSSYSEKYRGTQWSQPTQAPPPPEPTRRGRPRLFSLFLLVSGLLWLVPGLLGLGADVALGLNHSLLGYAVPHALESSLGTLIAGSALIQIIWVLVGLKLLLAPGGRTLGCAGLLWLVASASLLLAVANVPNQPQTTIVFLGVVIAFTGVMGLVSVFVAQW